METGEWIGITSTLLIAIFGMGVSSEDGQPVTYKIEAGDAETRVEVRRVEADVSKRALTLVLPMV